ncbi:hypothetical protein M9H77_30530 [Catharanthus roseus]|uniref:Uncharacterized protein n=1 Tax=Catharanthus roseus TaxID=4058 RepID=A0ACB9ZZS4_CATRO|nr:hypothetical protein M9H77_30530 [Catharanthus roseus]
MLKGDQNKKASSVEESSRDINLPQAVIKIKGSVEVHVEEEMSKECMSFEEEESIDFERKDRVEEKERLVENSSFFDSISSLGAANHYTFGFLQNNSYVFGGSLFSLLVVEHFQYVLTSFDTYVKNCVEQILVDGPLFVVKGLLEHFLYGLKFFLVEISFKTLLERAFGFNFFLVHYEEFLLSKEFENQMGSFLKTNGTNICEFMESSKCWHDILDIISLVVDSFSSWTSMWGTIPSYILEPFVRNFLVKKIEGYLCSLIRDFLNKSIKRNFERCSYMIPYFETFVIALMELILQKNHFLNMKGQPGNPCNDHKIIIGLKFLNAFLIENILGFKFYHLHFKESMFFVNL